MQDVPLSIVHLFDRAERCFAHKTMVTAELGGRRRTTYGAWADRTRRLGGVLDDLGISDPVLDTARELEQIALKDEYFIEKKLYPNVDFYSGVILNAIGFPTEMFTALFALARTVGWVAQWNEMISDPEQKIGRPRQLYVGATQRDYVPVGER